MKLVNQNVEIVLLEHMLMTMGSHFVVGVDQGDTRTEWDRRRVNFVRRIVSRTDTDRILVCRVKRESTRMRWGTHTASAVPHLAISIYIPMVTILKCCVNVKNDPC